MALSADLFYKPWNFWQLFTSGFAHDSKDVWHIGLNMLALWFFGREVEVIYGKRLFLSLYLTLLVMSGVFWVAAENWLLHPATEVALAQDRFASCVGASGAVFGIVVVFVLHYPTRQLLFFGLFPIPVALLAGLYLLQEYIHFKGAVAGGVSHIAHAAHLAGAGFGALFYYTRFTLLSLVPDFLLRLGEGKRVFRRRPKLRVHDPELADDEDDLSMQVDAILEKISREGQASLTRQERRILEDASRRYQQKRR
jgi:membrane associated rhomboid family serine protease